MVAKECNNKVHPACVDGVSDGSCCAVWIMILYEFKEVFHISRALVSHHLPVPIKVEERREALHREVITKESTLITVSNLYLTSRSTLPEEAYPSAPPLHPRALPPWLPSDCSTVLPAALERLV
jgi:hypothetical protein